MESSERKYGRLNISKMLLKKYGLRTTLQPLEITVRRNRKVYKVQTKDRNYALKEYNRSIDINYHVSLLDRLDKNGFHQSPKVITTLDGSSSVESDGTTYVLSEWIDGIEPSFSNIIHLKAASALLASFHRAARFPNQEVIKAAPNSFLDTPTFREIKVGQNKMSTISEKLNEWVKQFGSDPLRIALERMEYAEFNFPIDSYIELFTSEKKENSFNHGDYNSTNLILTPKNKLYVIDFDGSSFSVRINDLLFLCHLHMGDNAKMLLDILKSYHQVRPLSLKEFDIVKSILFVPGNIYWIMHINTYLHNPIDSDWITQHLSRYSGKDYFEKIKKLSYSDLS